MLPALGAPKGRLRENAGSSSCQLLSTQQLCHVVLVVPPERGRRHHFRADSRGACLRGNNRHIVCFPLKFFSFAADRGEGSESGRCSGVERMEDPRVPPRREL